MITPMKRLNTNFRTLKILLTDFEYFVLNKSNSKNIPYPFEPKDRLTGEYKSYTKGVKNDFTLIFKNIKTDISVGFVINYLKDFDNPVFFVTIKYGSSNKSILKSNEMNIDQFKNKINHLNKKLRNGYENQIDKISFVFFDEKYDIEKYNKLAEDEIAKIVGCEYAECEKLKTKYKNDLNNLNATRDIVESEISELDEFKRVQELEILLSKANDKLSVKRTKIEDRKNISSLESSLIEQEKVIRKLNGNLTFSLIKLKNKFPVLIERKIREISDLRIKLNKNTRYSK